MIKRLQNQQEDIAVEIRNVFQLSYAVEARLLDADDFPPLKRPLESFVESNEEFYGYYVSAELAGVIAIDFTDRGIHINSLVVKPAYFRRGIGRQLIEFIFEQHQVPFHSVATGAKNAPAIALYEKLGFKVVKEWDTDFGIRKVFMERE
tara:strand:+ start:894 stop:1340 length:447 start_codon:yes stop_codon:yes gene_type:complete